MVTPIKTTKAKVAQRPAETAAPAVFVAVTGVLTAFGLDPAKAAAISGLLAAVTPMVVTYVVSKRA